MRPKQFSYTPADDSTNGMGAALTAASGVALPLTASSAGDSLAHLIIITPTGSITGSFVITGTDPDGNTQSETLATNTVSAVTSVKYYKTVTSITAPSGLGAETVSVGWTDDIVSPTFVPDYKQEHFTVGIGCDISGTINYDIQHTFDDILGNKTANNYGNYTWFDHSSIAAKTADADGNYAAGVRGIRFLINSLTAGATIKVTYVQGSA